MPFYVYILLCTDGSFYTGYTKNIDERTRLHANGKGARYTRTHKPERVAYVELLESRAEPIRNKVSLKEKLIKNLRQMQHRRVYAKKETNMG